MADITGIILASAIAVVSVIFTTHQRAENQLRTLDWQEFMPRAEVLGSIAHGLNETELAEATRSNSWFGQRCEAVARTAVAEPDTGRTISIALAFVGYCQQGVPNGAVVLHTTIKGDAGDGPIATARLALPATHLNLGLVGATQNPEDPTIAVTQAELEGLLNVKPIRAGALPPWPVGARAPELPNGLSWHGTINRDAYEAIRAENGMVICLHQVSMYCAAHNPDRAAPFVPVLAASGLMTVYRLRHQADAVDVLTGARPELSTEQAAAEIQLNQRSMMAAIEKFIQQ